MNSCVYETFRKHTSWSHGHRLIYHKRGPHGHPSPKSSSDLQIPCTKDIINHITFINH